MTTTIQSRTQLRGRRTYLVADRVSGRAVMAEPVDLTTPPTGRAAQFTTVAVLFPRHLTDEEAEQAAGLFGYAWQQHGAGVRTGRVVADTPVVWPAADMMTVTARMDRRPERTRSRSQATVDLFNAFITYLKSGTPIRKDATRLLPPLDDLTYVVIYTGSTT